MIRLAFVAVSSLALITSCSPDVSSSEVGASQSALDRTCTTPIEADKGTLEIPSRCVNFLDIPYRALAQRVGQFNLHVLHDTRTLHENFPHHVFVPAAIVIGSRWVPCQRGETMLKDCNDLSRIPANLLYSGRLVGHTTRHTGHPLTFEANGAVTVVNGQAFIQSAGGVAESVVRVTTQEVFGTQRVPPFAGGILYLPGFHCQNGGPTCEPCNDQSFCDIMPNAPGIPPGGFVDIPPLLEQCGGAGQVCCAAEPLCQVGLQCNASHICESPPPPDGGT
jgi:hypothetical protein